MKKEKGPVQKWSVDTKDGFHEKVDKKELLKWGKSTVKSSIEKL